MLNYSAAFLYILKEPKVFVPLSISINLDHYVFFKKPNSPKPKGAQLLTLSRLRHFCLGVGWIPSPDGISGYNAQTML